MDLVKLIFNRVMDIVGVIIDLVDYLGNKLRVEFATIAVFVQFALEDIHQLDKVSVISIEFFQYLVHDAFPTESTGRNVKEVRG